MKAKFNFRKTGMIVIISLAVVMSVGFVTLKDKEFDIVKNLEIFHSLFNELNQFCG
jgi:hypothetical protein